MFRNFTKSFGFLFVLFIVFLTNSISINAQNCNVPGGLNVTNLSNFTASLNWAADTNVVKYRVRYKKVGDTSWVHQYNNVAGASKNIFNLFANTSYVWQAKSVCSFANSTWSVLDTFMTTNFSIDCNNTFSGTAFIDSCGNCVGGTTGNQPCIGFSPSVSISLSTNECNVLSDIIFSTSQDSNEVDMASTFVSSSGGFFDFSNLSPNDTIGSSVIVAGGG